MSAAESMLGNQDPRCCRGIIAKEHPPRVSVDPEAWLAQSFVLRRPIDCERLVLARQRAGYWNAEHVASVAPFTSQSMRTWERGLKQPSPEKVCLLAILFQVSVEWLQGGDG